MAKGNRNSSITNPYENSARQEASKGVLADTEDIDKLYTYLAQQEKVLENVKTELQNKRIKDAQEKTKEQALKLANFELDLAKSNLNLTEEQRKAMRMEFLNQEADAERKLQEETLAKRFKVQSDLENARTKLQDTQRQKDIQMTQVNMKVLQAQRDLEKAKKDGNADEIKKKQQILKDAQKERKEKDKELTKELQIHKQQKEILKEKRAEEKEKNQQKFVDNLFGIVRDEETGLKDMKKTIGGTLSEDLKKTLAGVGKAITESLNQINTAISSYASYQTEINARLQGVGDFGKSVETLSDVAFSPLIKSEELYANLSELVSEGIASNVEQKAFLQTVKKGIATTFDVNNATLKQIVRMQQFDSTAARLGMEAYLTRFLNEFVQNTEYLTTTFDNVTASLLQATSTMGGQEATEFEYQVQKWLGALTGVGLSDATANAIATAIGQLGSGDISGLSSSQMQNLMVMAASRSGNLNYADMLTGGLNYNTTNYLMSSVVSYLQELGSYSNNVVKSQLAQTFGVSMSDLMALTKNLKGSDLETLLNTNMSYSGMYEELAYQMGQLKTREGISNILENLFSNLTYQTGMNIASNPALYATWKITDLIQGVTGGINIPFISAMGSGFDLNTTVENLMKLAIVGVSTFSNIGDIISGVSSVGNGASLLNKLGISASAGSNVLKRGSGLTARSSGMSTSLSTMVGNTEGSDYYDASLMAAEDEANQKMADVQSETNDYTEKTYTLLEDNFVDKVTSIDDNITKIYDFLSTEATYMSFTPTMEGLTTGAYDI